jgi:hypothetical protein
MEGGEGIYYGIRKKGKKKSRRGGAGLYGRKD